MGLFEPLFRALNASGGRYVVVGGLATVLHGHARLTADVDLVVDFDPRGLATLLDALVAHGLRPRPPSPPHSPALAPPRSTQRAPFPRG